VPQNRSSGIPTTWRDWKAAFSSLSIPNYRWFWFSTTASFAAMQMQMVVRGWLVFEMTESPLALGIVSAGAGAFIILFSLFGGVVADRVDKRNLLAATQLFAGIATLVVAILITTGLIAFWHLVVASVVNGLILAFRLPVRQAIIPELVESNQVMNAVALNSSAMNLNRIVAPALAGVLVGVMGIDSVYYLMVLCYFASAILMIRVPSTGKPIQATGTTFRREIAEGITYVRKSPELWGLLLTATIPILFGMPYQMLMPGFVAEVLGRQASALGFLMASVGIGALMGSLLVASLGDYKYKGRLLFGGAVVFGLTLIIFALSRNFYLSMGVLVIVGAASASYMAVNTTLLMMNSEERMRGRVMSIYMVTIGLYPLGVLPAGAIAEYTGITLPVAVGGAIMVVFILTMMLINPRLIKL